MGAHFLFLDHPCIPFLTSVCSCTLRHIQQQFLSWWKLNVAHGNQYSQNPENEPKMARSLETRWKLLSNIKTDDSSFKRKRN